MGLRQCFDPALTFRRQDRLFVARTSEFFYFACVFIKMAGQLLHRLANAADIRPGLLIASRLTAFRSTHSYVVQQRVHAGFGNVGITLKIPSGIEGRARIAFFFRAESQIVLNGVPTLFRHVGIIAEIPIAIETARLFDDGNLLLDRQADQIGQFRQ